MDTEEFVAGPGGRLRVRVDGDAKAQPAILFVHADLGRLEQWDGTRERLKSRLCTIVFDRRGHGESDVPRDGKFGPSDSAADMASVLDGLNIDKAILVAHSGGTLGAWTFAIQHDDRVQGLLMVDPPLESAVIPKEIIDRTIAALRGPHFAQAAEQYYRSIAGPNPEIVDRVVADALATPQATMVGTFEALRDFRPSELAGRFRGPILSVIQPSLDVDGAFHRIPPGFPHVAVPETGHWIHLDAPGAVVSCLEDFVAPTAAGQG